MATYRDYQPNKYDDFFTQEELWKDISKYIPKNKKIYMPFFSPYSNCNELLSKYIDNEIVYQDKDFFSYKINDGIVCDNPPFSIKKQILNKLHEDDTPFMLILPISSICYNYFKKCKENLQILIPRKRPKYNKCDKEGNIYNSNSSPAFDSAIFCYKIGLTQDINFI